MSVYILLSNKDWHRELFDTLSIRSLEDWIFYSDSVELDLLKISAIGPKKIFIPHWSSKIDNQIIENYDCVIFHMTDLPYGRGGSPLQNLIVRGYDQTMITALKATNEIDAGPVYLKVPLSLLGTAEEIFIRSSKVIKSMIERIIDEDINPEDQIGNPTFFKRRKPEESDISGLTNLEHVFDYIRMLDCEGYPAAFLETKYFRFEFTRASLKADGEIIADVRIIQK